VPCFGISVSTKLRSPARSPDGTGMYTSRRSHSSATLHARFVAGAFVPRGYASCAAWGSWCSIRPRAVETRIFRPQPADLAPPREERSGTAPPCRLACFLSA